MKSVDRESVGARSESVWREVRGASIILSELEEKRRETAVYERGLVRCPVCGGEARVCVFGLFRDGVIVGCSRSLECVRNMEYHGFGWSVEKTCVDWNRRNSGVLGAIRRLKRGVCAVVGSKRAEEREWERVHGEELSRLEAGRASAFGVEPVPTGRSSKLCEKLIAIREKFRPRGRERTK